MPTSVLFGASLFDSPWVVAVLIIGSALTSWLSKRRQQKQAERPSEGGEPPLSPVKPPGEFNLEETLRRLMGEESPPRVPGPPPLPRTLQSDRTPTPEWSYEEVLQPAEPAPPTVRQPSALARVSVAVRENSQLEEQAALRFEQLNEQGRHPAVVVNHAGQHLSRSGPRVATRWRDSRSVRQAFVASIVLAPPKSLEL